MPLAGYEEVNYLLLNADGERTYGGVHHAAVDAHHCMVGLQDFHLLRAIGMHGAVVEELASHEEIDALEELRHLWVVDHRDVELSVVGHGVGCLAVAEGVANADGHHLSLHLVGVDLQVHLVLQSLEDHQDEREEERQRARAEVVARLAAQVHDGCHESDVDAVQEVAAAMVALLADVANAAEVDLADAALLQPADGLLHVVLVELPEVRKVVHHAIGHHAQHNLLALLLVNLHEAVHGIVQCRVASHDDDGLIAVGDEHFHQAVYAARVLALHVVVVDALSLQAPLNLLPPFLRRTPIARLRTIEYSPLLFVHIVGQYRLFCKNNRFSSNDKTFGDECLFFKGLKGSERE